MRKKKKKKTIMIMMMMMTTMMMMIIIIKPKCTGVLPRGYSGRAADLTTRHHSVPRLRISGAIPHRPLYSFTVWTRKSYLFMIIEDDEVIIIIIIIIIIGTEIHVGNLHRHGECQRSVGRQGLGVACKSDHAYCHSGKQLVRSD